MCVADQINCLFHFEILQSASGPGLAFIVFTEVVTRMPGSQIWSILFFLMLFCLGLSSMFGLIQGILTPFIEIPLVSKYLRKEVSCGKTAFEKSFNFNFFSFLFFLKLRTVLLNIYLTT